MHAGQEKVNQRVRTPEGLHDRLDSLLRKLKRTASSMTYGEPGHLAFLTLACFEFPLQRGVGHIVYDVEWSRAERNTVSMLGDGLLIMRVGWDGGSKVCEQSCYSQVGQRYTHSGEAEIIDRSRHREKRTQRKANTAQLN